MKFPSHGFAASQGGFASARGRIANRFVNGEMPPPPVMASAAKQSMAPHAAAWIVSSLSLLATPTPVIPGRAAWRGPGIHNHETSLLREAGAPWRFHNKLPWLWFPDSRFRAPRNDGGRHGEERSDEAIHVSACGAMDGVAALAMTAGRTHPRHSGTRRLALARNP